MNSETRGSYRLGLLIVALAAADQLSKSYLRSHTIKHWPWPGVFEFTQHSNFGLIANTPVPRLVIIILTCAIMAYIAYRTFSSQANETIWSRTALSLILGGALGNLLDRLRLGYVFDWMMFGNTSIMNLSDAFICIGIAWYAWLYFKTSHKTIPNTTVDADSGKV